MVLTSMYLCPYIGSRVLGRSFFGGFVVLLWVPLRVSGVRGFGFVVALTTTTTTTTSTTT